MRVLERFVAGVTLTACGAWALYLLLYGSDAGVPFFPALLVLGWGGVAILVLWVLRTVLHLAVTWHAPERRRLRRILVEPVALLVCVAFVASGAAFWVRFKLSQSLLNNYVSVSSTSAPDSFKSGVRVGLFRLRDVQVLPKGVVRMITTECGVVDTCGVVFSPAGRPPVLGEDVYSSLGGSWYHWYRRF